MTEITKRVVTGLAVGVPFWTVLLATVVMALQRACAS